MQAKPKSNITILYIGRAFSNEGTRVNQAQWCPPVTPVHRSQRQAVFCDFSPAWSTEQVLGQTMLNSENFSQKSRKRREKKKNIFNFSLLNFCVFHIYHSIIITFIDLFHWHLPTGTPTTPD